jgi:2-polyprenyl-3-methyl-5-hydroxy-6-metoxy-1,4-benzoquinol methylase
METANFQESSSDFITIDGIKYYDIQSAYENPDYPAEYLHFLFEIEENYFWFKVRNLILRYLFERYLGRGPYKVMEIGAGNGIVLKALQSLGYQLTAAELYLTGLKNIQKRLPDIQLVQLNILRIPFREVYDAIGAFDVIEHIENDDRAIQNLYQALRPGVFYFSRYLNTRFYGLKSMSIVVTRDDTPAPAYSLNYASRDLASGIGLRSCSVCSRLS